jgi:hypothetical protein
MGVAAGLLAAASRNEQANSLGSAMRSLSLDSAALFH